MDRKELNKILSKQLDYGSASSNDRPGDLSSRKRATHPNSGKLMPHSASRHLDFGDDSVKRMDGTDFTQGRSLFPPNVRPGDVSALEKIVKAEYEKYLRGLDSNVISAQSAGGGVRIMVRVNMFGVEQVGSFMRGRKPCTIFPEDEN